MKMLTRKMLLKGLLVSAVALGVVGSASAAVCDAYGNCYPVCRVVWIQTGPFQGQGYYTQVCN
jgi:hypothetical protein